ncbi:hypothetical protein C8R45DRAFT_929275 [Mycena sanguinolenta]|nr:hypothetical protein C8R45DRAFT_929275 [Mycena sanguinolenta]
MSTSFVLASSLTEGVLELTLYGAFVVLFFTVVYLFSTRGLISRKRPSFFVFLALVGLFLSITAHWINGICALYQAFISLGGGFPAEVLYLTLSSPRALAHNSLVVVTTVITDSLMIHRLYTVWSHDGRVIIFPLLVLAGQVASGIHVIYDLSRETIFNFFDLSNPWETSYLVSSLEALALEDVCGTMTVGVLVTFQTGLLVQAALIALQPVVFGISVLLIHLRVSLGWTDDSNLAGSGSMENSVNLTRISMRRGTRESDLELGKDDFKNDSEIHTTQADRGVHPPSVYMCRRTLRLLGAGLLGAGTQ